MISNYLKEYLKKRIEQMATHKPKSYTNRIRKHECKLLLKKIELYEKNDIAEKITMQDLENEIKK